MSILRKSSAAASPDHRLKNHAPSPPFGVLTVRRSERPPPIGRKWYCSSLRPLFLWFRIVPPPPSCGRERGMYPTGLTPGPFGAALRAAAYVKEARNERKGVEAWMDLYTLYCRMAYLFRPPKWVKSICFGRIRLRFILSFSVVPAEIVQADVIVVCDLLQFS